MRQELSSPEQMMQVQLMNEKTRLHVEGKLKCFAERIVFSFFWGYRCRENGITKRLQRLQFVRTLYS